MASGAAISVIRFPSAIVKSEYHDDAAGLEVGIEDLGDFFFGHGADELFDDLAAFED